MEKIVPKSQKVQLFVHSVLFKFRFSGQSKKSPCLLNQVINQISTGNLITIEVIAAFQLPYFEAIYTFM
jgi:hypothetical protein